MGQWAGGFMKCIHARLHEMSMDVFVRKRFMISARCLLSIAAFSGFVSVALGAFGAHFLKSRLDSYSIGVFQTGIEYQFYHTFAVALVGMLSLRVNNSLLQMSGVSFLLGILFFSLSLYLLALTQLKWLGAITPIGGLFFLMGWVLLFVSVLRSNRS